MLQFQASVFFLALIIGVGGCGDSSGGDDNSDSPTVPAEFAAVDEQARATFDALGIDGMGVAVYRADGTLVFESMYGNFTADQRIFVASASKIISGTLLFALITHGDLALDSTTGDVLGWQGDKASITLRHLLSFRSGLDYENRCTYIVNTTLEECVAQIYQADMLSVTGTQFDYGSTHLHVAARMAEVATGQSWNTLFANYLRIPLGLPDAIAYYTRPDNLVLSENPLPAGGLVISMREYAQLLNFIYHKGEWRGAQLIDVELFDQQTIDPYPDAIIGNTPAESPSARYGLSAWLECDTPATGCAVISSPGLYGFTPWIDREHGYYAIIGMENRDLSQRGESVALEQALKPLIVDALSQMH